MSGVTTFVGLLELLKGELVDHAWVQRFVAAHTRLVELGCRLEAEGDVGLHCFYSTDVEKNMLLPIWVYI